MSKMYSLLITLMLAGVSLSACGASRAGSNTQNTIVSVDRSGQIYLQESKVDMQDLAPKLKTMTGGNLDAQIYVRGDKDVSYGRIMEVLNTISASGFKKAALVAKSPDSDSFNHLSRLTISEEDALRKQISQCWNVPVGNGAANISVAVTVDVDQDGIVKKAEIVDKDRINSDPYFRSMAESVLHAIHNPKCSPLKLPADKYDQWKHMDLTFDPRDML